MLNENAKLWIEDLRKNKDLQGRGRLHIITIDGTEKFCCLGRACVLYNHMNQNKLGISQEEEPLVTTIFYSGNAAVLPNVS